MKVYVIKNGKGGCDKTTATINLSALMAEVFHEKVLVIDTDARGRCTEMFCKGNEFDYQIGDAMLNTVNVKDTILKTDYPNLDIIPCGEEVEICMKELEKKIFMSPMNRLSIIVDEINKLNVYDRCFIDCSQNADLMAVNTFMCADEVLIPARSDESSKDGIYKMMEWIDQVNSTREKKLKFRVMITDRENNKESTLTIGEIQDLVGERLCKTIIRHQAKPVARSIRKEVLKPFVLEKKLSKVALDYIDLAKELFEYEEI